MQTTHHDVSTRASPTTSCDSPPAQATRRLHEGMLRRLELGFYQLVLAPLVAFLPASIAYGVARLRGSCCYRLDGYARRRLLRGLEVVWGERFSAAERAQIAHNYLRLRSCEAVDIRRLAGTGQALARLVDIRGLDYLQAALARGKGVILCSAHYGSYQSAFSLLGACGFPVTVIGRYPSEADSDRSAVERAVFRLMVQKPLERLLQRPSIQPREGHLASAVEAAQALGHNEVVCVAIDPPVRRADRARAVWVPFLGKRALLLPGPVVLAQLTGAPVLMAFMRRLADGRHQVLEITPPISVDGDVLQALRACIARLEAVILQDPSQWRYWNWPGLCALGLVSDGATDCEV